MMTRTGGNTHLGVLIFMETHSRILSGKFGKIPRPLRDWAFAEGGYCIDAPQLLAAGACEFMECGPPPEGEPEPYGLPDQITVERP